MRTDPHVLAYHDPSRPPEMGDYRTPQGNLGPIPDLNALGILVLDVNLISDKDVTFDLDASTTMKQRPECRAPGPETGTDVEQAI